MATTLATFVTALQGISVTGVTRVFLAPPASLTTADLPALWVHTAGTSETPVARSTVSWPAHRAEIWLAIQPVSQGRPDQAFAAMLSFADLLRVALRTATLAISQATIAVRTDILGINEKAYWGVVATVEAAG